MARGVAFEDEQAGFDAMVRPLIERGALAPIAAREADAQLWMDCDLWSFVANRWDRRLAPTARADDDRALWLGRALAEDERLWDPRRSQFTAAFWLIDRGVRAGTLALSRVSSCHSFLSVSSL